MQSVITASVAAACCVAQGFGRAQQSLVANRQLALVQDMCRHSTDSRENSASHVHSRLRKLSQQDSNATSYMSSGPADVISKYETRPPKDAGAQLILPRSLAS